MGIYPATKVMGKCRDKKLPRRRQANVILQNEFSVMRVIDDDTAGAKLTRTRACNSRAGVLLRRRSVRALAIVRNHQVIERANEPLACTRHCRDTERHWMEIPKRLSAGESDPHFVGTSFQESSPCSACVPNSVVLS